NRFIINSTVGLLGLMDPAKEYMHIPAHNEDFGQTLGFYGVGPGFHIVLPFFGPSNVRDLTGITIDAYVSPLVNIRGLENYKIPDNFAQSAAIVAWYFVNKNSLESGQYESIKKDAIELYPFLRDIYEQKRVSEIEE
ncbi:MAG: VacJ family lipoprotein, partial [Epsilonproteobacteria bacterium]